jgi:pimeloyl-ACP methyl ester carboxylesterase
MKILLVVLTSLLICALSVIAFAANTAKKKFISYSEVGKGKTIVLIHAFPTDKTLWNAQLTGLKNHFHVVVIDLWGFGESASTNGQAITMSTYADEIKQLLDQLHIQKAIIGGESMGGYVSLAFLEKYPNKVEGLILSNTQAIADDATAIPQREASAKNLEVQGSSELIKSFMSKVLSPTVDEHTRDVLHTILIKQSPLGMASALRGMALRSDTSHLLTQATIPILIITSDQDMVIPPAQSRAMHALAKNSDLVIISNAGHLSNLEQPNAWNQAVIKKFYRNKRNRPVRFHTL